MNTPQGLFALTRCFYRMKYERDILKGQVQELRDLIHAKYTLGSNLASDRLAMVALEVETDRRQLVYTDIEQPMGEQA